MLLYSDRAFVGMVSDVDWTIWYDMYVCIVYVCITCMICIWIYTCCTYVSDRTDFLDITVGSAGVSNYKLCKTLNAEGAADTIYVLCNPPRIGREVRFQKNGHPNDIYEMCLPEVQVYGYLFHGMLYNKHSFKTFMGFINVKNLPKISASDCAHYDYRGKTRVYCIELNMESHTTFHFMFLNTIS